MNGCGPQSGQAHFVHRNLCLSGRHCWPTPSVRRFVFNQRERGDGVHFLRIETSVGV